MSRPLAVVGDIHGDADRLSAILDEVQDRRLIFVGDYVNRGSDSRKTMDLLLGVRRSDPTAVFLVGNHEVALLEFLDGSLPFHEFATIGGLATIKAYLPRAFGDVRVEFQEVFPDAHRRFLEECEMFFETPDLIVSHCGLDPRHPAGREKLDMAMASHHELFAPECELPKLVICGHYSQSSGLPFVRENLICLDTGCGTEGGPLTALLMPERTFFQR